MLLLFPRGGGDGELTVERGLSFLAASDDFVRSTLPSSDLFFKLSLF